MGANWMLQSASRPLVDRGIGQATAHQTGCEALASEGNPPMKTKSLLILMLGAVALSTLAACESERRTETTTTTEETTTHIVPAASTTTVTRSVPAY
jgi:hypothetical protein